MQYCLRNETDKAISAFGIIIQPGSVSRPLSESELARAWGEEADGVTLVPFLAESDTAAAAPPWETTEETTQKTRTAPGAQRRGRKQAEESEEQ